MHALNGNTTDLATDVLNRRGKITIQNYLYTQCQLASTRSCPSNSHYHLGYTGAKRRMMEKRKQDGAYQPIGKQRKTQIPAAKSIISYLCQNDCERHFHRCRCGPDDEEEQTVEERVLADPAFAKTLIGDATEVLQRLDAVVGLTEGSINVDDVPQRENNLEPSVPPAADRKHDHGPDGDLSELRGNFNGDTSFTQAHVDLHLATNTITVSVTDSQADTDFSVVSPPVQVVPQEDDVDSVAEEIPSPSQCEDSTDQASDSGESDSTPSFCETDSEDGGYDPDVATILPAICVPPAVSDDRVKLVVETAVKKAIHSSSGDVEEVDIHVRGVDVSTNSLLRRFFKHLGWLEPIFDHTTLQPIIDPLIPLQSNPVTAKLRPLLPLDPLVCGVRSLRSKLGARNLSTWLPSERWNCDMRWIAPRSKHQLHINESCGFTAKYRGCIYPALLKEVDQSRAMTLVNVDGSAEEHAVKTVLGLVYNAREKHPECSNFEYIQNTAMFVWGMYLRRQVQMRILSGCKHPKIVYAKGGAIYPKMPIFPHRKGPEECQRVEDIVFNERFRVLKGREYWHAGRIKFPTDVPKKRDGGYRTIFGGLALHDPILENSNFNLDGGVTRLTAARLDPDVADPPRNLDFDKMLLQNQEVFIRKHTDVLEQLFRSYQPSLTGYTTHVEENIVHVHDPHQKRKLREEAHLREEIEGTAYDLLKTGLEGHINYKAKTQEIAKVNKFIRAIADLGVTASLRGYRLAEFIKTAMSDHPFEWKGGKIFFCKDPSPDRLIEVFNELRNPSGRFAFVYFSDDACFSFRVNGKIIRGNCDISKCDLSHGPSIFSLFLRLAAEGPRDMKLDANLLVMQCLSTCTIRDVNKRRRKIVLQPLAPVLYSGSTITTLINNLANILIAIAMAEVEVVTVANLKAAARNCGYIVTIEECPELDQLQFLKHSPVEKPDGSIVPLLNIGVLMRLVGRCRGDLPGSGDIGQRAKAFQSALLSSAYPHTRIPFVEKMKAVVAGAPCTVTQRTLIEKQVADTLSFKIGDTKTTKTYDVTDAEALKRYRLSDAEHEFVCEHFATSPMLVLHADSSLSKIVEKDYGLVCNFQPLIPDDRNNAQGGY